MYQNESPVAGSLQIRALEHLWKDGPAVVHAVVDAINAEGKPRLAYTTILTVLRNLVRRGMCTQSRGPGKSHTFTPALTRDEYRAKVARWFVDEQFAGDVKAAASVVAALR